VPAHSSTLGVNLHPSFQVLEANNGKLLLLFLEGEKQEIMQKRVS
jgi:hypothetical protein